MALSQSKLESNLVTWMGDFRSLSQGATELANQYDSYALDAVDVTGDTPDQVFPDAMANTLESGWSIGLSYEQSAQVIEDAVQAYWDGGTFKLENPPSGAVIETSADVVQVPTDDSIKTDLADNMSQGAGSAGEADASMAELWAPPIHSGTETTVVKNVGEDSDGNTVTEKGSIT